jgi:hypothetical protein
MLGLWKTTKNGCPCGIGGWRLIWALTLVCLPPAHYAWGDVVYSNSYDTSSPWALNDPMTMLAERFTNSGAAGSVQTVTLRLSSSNNTTLGGTLQLKLFQSTGSAPSYVPTGAGTGFAVATLAASQIGSSWADFTFTGFTAHTLASGGSYFLAIDVSAVTGLDVSSQKQLRIAAGTGSGTGLAGQNAAMTYNQAASWNAIGGSPPPLVGGTISVPEPGTLLLGTVAALGGLGALHRRGRGRPGKGSGITGYFCR